MIPIGLSSEDERDQERRHTADSAGKDLIDFGIRKERVDALALPACEGSRVLRLGRYVVADYVDDILAVGDDDAKAARGRGKGDEHRAGADQLAQATGNELEQAGEISLLEDTTRELVERFELPNPVGGPLVDLHFLDREAGLGCEQRHDLFVCFGELTALLLGQVEIPIDDLAHKDRDTKEAPHLRMARREPEEVRFLRHVGNAYRARVSEQDAKNPVVAR